MLKAIIIIFITVILAFIYQLEMSFVNFFLQRLQYRTEYLYQSPFVGYLIYVAVHIGIVLLASLLLRSKVRKKKTIAVGVITGVIAAVFCPLAFVLVSQSVHSYITLLWICPAIFIVGFLFPVLFKFLSRKPLFNENFY